jgi:hypothetical protein
MASRNDAEEDVYRGVDLSDVSPQLHVKITRKKKVDYMLYAQDHHQGNISSMLVEAMDKLINDNWILESHVEVEQNVDVDLSGIDELQSQMVAMREDMEAMREQTDALSIGPVDTQSSELSEEELLQLANVIRDRLPIVPSEKVIRQLNHTSTLETGDYPKIAGTVDAIARVVDEDELEVRQALIYLERHEYESVKSTIQNGTRRWFEENENVDDWEMNAYLNEVIPEDVREEFEDYEFVSGTEYNEEYNNG